MKTPIVDYADANPYTVCTVDATHRGKETDIYITMIEIRQLLASALMLLEEVSKFIAETNNGHQVDREGIGESPE